jgi:hypothetical protein
MENTLAFKIKTHWHKEEKERSIDEIAGAIAFSGWRIAVDKAVNLHSEHFDYSSHQQRLGVIIEYLLFQAQVVDRLVHDDFSAEERRKLIITLVARLAEHVQSNSEDMLGAGDYQTPFFELFNQRMQEYSELSFDDEGPSYPFMRHLGYEIQQLMGDKQENRWVIDQVMDKDGLEVYSQLKRLVKSLTT